MLKALFLFPHSVSENSLKGALLFSNFTDEEIKGWRSNLSKVKRNQPNKLVQQGTEPMSKQNNQLDRNKILFLKSSIIF